MSHGPRRLSDRKRAELVAFLDGELGEAESKALRDQLAQSELVRRELETLEQTWELLDFLPRHEASPELIGRTLSGSRLIPVDEGPPTRWFARAFTFVLLIGLGFGLGLQTACWLWPDPSARLTRELSLAEHLDAFRVVGSLEDLQRLEQLPDD